MNNIKTKKEASFLEDASEKSFNDSSLLRKQLEKNLNKESFFISCRESRIESPQSFYGCFYLGPFSPSQSLTVANALRRTLLSDLKGLAITSVEIDGVLHEYSTLEGVKESVLDILLNLKEIVLKATMEIKKPQMGYLGVRGPGVIRAGDLKLPLGVQCVDPTQYICSLSDDGFLSMRFKIRQGKNFVIQNTSKNYNSEEIKVRQLLLRKLTTLQKYNQKHSFETEKKGHFSLLREGFGDNALLSLKSKPLLIDAIFMPITKVNYSIESECRGLILEEKDLKNPLHSQTIVLEIWTNGSILPRIALAKAFQKLLRIFSSLEKIQIRNSLVFKSFTLSNQNYDKIIEKLQSIHFKNKSIHSLNKKNLEMDSNSINTSDWSDQNKFEHSSLLREQLQKTKKSSSNTSNLEIDANLLPEQLDTNLLRGQLDPLMLPKSEFRSSKFPHIAFLNSEAKNYWTIQKFKLTDIGNLNISLRPYTCLKRANINTLFDLIKYTKKDLLKFKNFGRKSLEEIEKSLNEIGIVFLDF